MNKQLNLLMLCLGFSMMLSAQPYYTIQLGTFLDAQQEDFSAVQPLGFVHAEKTGANLYVIYVGGFENRAAAEKAWEQIRNKGYVNAFIQERIPAQGQPVTMIQVATRNTTKPIRWEEYANLGNLYANINGNTLKIMTGTYPNAEAAKEALTNIKKAGFKDAFIKNINTIYLHPLTEFETDLKKELIPFTLKDPTATVPPNTPPAYDYNNQPTGTPSVYDNIFTPRTPLPNATATNRNLPPATTVAAPAAPRIRSNVKRTSALNLQKILKTEGYYKGSLDGYYGNGTATAYNSMVKNSRELQKYLVLSNNTPIMGTAATSALQTAVNELSNDPTAIATLRASKAPIAKAYQAYYNFLMAGPSVEVNNSMNAAIKEAFAGKKLPTPIPFDYRATYAYNDLEQLLLHMLYLHSLPDNDLTAPCWLSQRHPKEMKAAFDRYLATASLEYPLKACDQFLTWDEIKLLHIIAMDLNPSKNLNINELVQSASLRTMLYNAPKQINASDVADTEAWNQKLMTGLDQWATTDPVNKQMVTAFKTAFYQSQVRLEDYFIDKGFKADAAENLALVTLRTLVEYHLERFI